MNDIPLNTVLEQNYLGIRLHHKLSWRPRVDHICSEPNIGKKLIQLICADQGISLQAVATSFY